MPADTTPSAPARSGELSYDVDPRDVAAALLFDSTTNTVTYPIVAGLTSANNAWNFNGYANGNMTIVVPVGARVVIPFSNLDGNVPHSMGLIAGSTSNLVAAPDQPLIFGASTRRYETGIRSVERDVVRFTASDAGEYLMVCGVPGHAAGGMWIRFHVSSRATRPEIRTRS
jgi:sulfocyanin